MTDRTLADIRADAKQDGAHISLVNPKDGTVVLWRDDYSVGSVSYASYITEPSARHAYGTRSAKLAPALTEGE